RRRVLRLFLPRRSSDLGDDHVGVAELQDLLGAEAIAAIDADVRQPLELGAAPVEDAAPGGEPREARLEAQPPADLVRRLRHAHLVAPPAERQRALEARGTCADHEDRARAPRLGDALGMPAAAPLFSDGRILGASHGHRIVPARDADVAADALADVLLASLVDLARQERVGDRGPRGADEIEHAAPDLTHHGFGAGAAAAAGH